MPRLPNAHQAEVPLEKLREYALNPLHDEGKHKARVFLSAMGLTQDDAKRLRELVLDAAQTREATMSKLLPEGQMYVLDFPADGVRGPVTIRTAWIVARGKDFPRLVTCYVRKKSR
jgi:Domain of unknown function (DUF6883)